MPRKALSAASGRIFALAVISYMDEKDTAEELCERLRKMKALPKGRASNLY